MNKISLLFLILICFSTSSLAQSSDEHDFEFFGGFSHNRIDTGIDDDDTFDFDSREGFNGFNASFTANVSRYFGVKSDFSGHYNKRTLTAIGGPLEVKTSLYNYLGGVQIKDNSEDIKIKPFAHVLVGGATQRFTLRGGPFLDEESQSDSSFSAILGGGLDIRAGKRFDIRVAQIDYNPTYFGSEKQHNFRIGFGIVIH